MILALDVSCIGYRNLFSVPEFASIEDTATAVLCGVLSDVLELGKKFRTNEMVFCFDSRTNFRRDIFPGYKNRTIDPAMKAKRDAMKRQLVLLYEYVLPKLGFNNRFMFEGLEADDIIAKICASALDQVTIISADEDLYQCLHGNVKMYDYIHKKEMDSKKFVDMYGIPTWKWGMVKAIAGCTSDTIPGIVGVGTKKAIQYLRNELKTNTKAYKAICEGSEIIARNSRLVMLPYESPGVDVILTSNKFSKKGFMEVCEEFGFPMFIENIDEWKQFFTGYTTEQDARKFYNRSRRGR